MKKSQIAVEHLLLVTLAILIIVPSILVYQNYIAHDPTKDNAIAAKLANDITDEVSSMIRLGSGWQTFTFDAPESVKRIDAKGNELLVRLADGTQQVAFLPQGTIASTEDGGLEVKPGKNRLKITYKSGVFCFSTLQGECNPCVDEDGDRHYWSSEGPEACPGMPWDCNDDVPWAYDNAESYCDGLDTNCDGEVDKDWDDDGDGFYACTASFDSCIQDRIELQSGDGEFGQPGFGHFFSMWYQTNPDLYFSIMNYPQGDYCQNLPVDSNTWYLCCDCDDGRDDVYPGAPERCDDIDRDCSNTMMERVDEGYPSIEVDRDTCDPDLDHNTHYYYILDDIIYCEQLKRSCAELYPEGTACHNYDEALCNYVGNDYIWEGCGSVPETGYLCFDGIDNDCDGLIDWQDPDCEGQTVFYIGFEDGFNRENCGRDACIPEIADHLEIVEGAGLRNSKAMKVLNDNAQFQYAIEGVPPSNEGSIFFFVKGNSDIWNNGPIVLYEAIVEENNYLRILYEDSYLYAVIKNGASEHSISEEVTLGNDWHLIAFTYTYQGSAPASNGRLFLDGSLLKSFSSFPMGSGWPAQTANEFLSMHLGTGAGELSGTDLLFDDIFIISEQVEDNYVSTVYDAMLCEELEPCNYVKGDINNDGCIDSQDIALIESAIAGEIEKNQCMDMNNDCRVNAYDLALALQQRTGCKYPGLQTCVQEESCVNGAPPWYCSADYELIPSCSTPDACGCPVGEVCTNNQCSGGSSPIMVKMPYDYGGPGWG